VEDVPRWNAGKLIFRDNWGSGFRFAGGVSFGGCGEVLCHQVRACIISHGPQKWCPGWYWLGHVLLNCEMEMKGGKERGVGGAYLCRGVDGEGNDGCWIYVLNREIKMKGGKERDGGAYLFGGVDGWGKDGCWMAVGYAF
jgi:hypothetical protein